MTKTQGDLLAEELRAVLTTRQEDWLDVLNLEDLLAAQTMGVRQLVTHWGAGGTVTLEDPTTGETVGSFRVSVSVEEIK
jgi:hypothetical protein